MYSIAIKKQKNTSVNDDEKRNDDVNNSKEKNDNNNVDNIDRSILPNQDIKRKSDNSSYSVSNTKIKFSTKGKHKILNDDDNNNDN